MKLNVKAYALACGVLWGGGLLLVGVLDTFTVWADPLGKAVATVYLGYTPTILGSVIIGIFGFVNAWIGGLLLSWLYNKFTK